jgi:hypothetical protein
MAWTPPYDPTDPSSRAAYLRAVSAAHDEWEADHADDPVDEDSLPRDKANEARLYPLDAAPTPAQDADFHRRVAERLNSSS